MDWFAWEATWRVPVRVLHRWWCFLTVFSSEVSSEVSSTPSRFRFQSRRRPIDEDGTWMWQSKTRRCHCFMIFYPLFPPVDDNSATSIMWFHMRWVRLFVPNIMFPLVSCAMFGCRSHIMSCSFALPCIHARTTKCEFLSVSQSSMSTWTDQVGYRLDIVLAEQWFSLFDDFLTLG